MDSKVIFVVKIRLDPKSEFREIETRSRLKTLREAEARVDEWFKFVAGLPKAKPEATIEATSMPHMADCYECKQPQYQGDIVFIGAHTFCQKCAYEVDVGKGYFDMLGEL